ncbi:hypothetical protein MPTK1_5g07490 [Marchantia polymorpha subsp. ruderalis]|uniref:Uncharacterized protein n=2 Tax=Marchantia polymorpha TaxID=3197 RepID=A0AAF6BFX8_MARPO|nr:hypothetical protein MARPO_0127s0035 [Marchantia polymorpha]BBN10912.1 hypothetical protein Mp_5g07490 [Marchantia polymorpha subsp. ruderalis]|eukprot:PTQ30252.1 hypothetical protein MARPO_0127s0035 [Marchantia polymorpha]
MTNHGARGLGHRSAKGRVYGRVSNKCRKRVSPIVQDAWTGPNQQNAGLNESAIATTRSRVLEVLRMGNRGRRVGLLLNLIQQQLRVQHSSFSSSNLRFPTNSGLLPLHQIRAHRLRCLLALAQHFDDRSCVSVSQNSPSISNPGSGIPQLASDLSTISLSHSL